MTSEKRRQITIPVPEPVARIGELMSTFGRPWCLCGGWAVDAWLGWQTREHDDVDVAIFCGDEGAMFDHLAGWELIAHGTLDADHGEHWDGRPLTFMAHVHARSRNGFILEVLLNERSRRDWILSRDPRITLPLDRCLRQSAWGMPTAAPAALLFYKATAYFGVEGITDRSRDEIDFFALLPRVTSDQRGWLREAISLVQPGHPWLARLSR